ncbi:MAG: hypothetical protein WC747_03630 [Candidatus Babeliales bacterium]|jgi:hypothetical protein
MAIKPEEYAADAFANQHATQDVLHAEQYLTSKKGFIAQHAQEGKDALDYVTQRQKEEPSSVLVYQARCAAIKAYSKMGLPWYYLAAAVDLAHPSQSTRHKIVTQALQDRFGVEA